MNAVRRQRPNISSDDIERLLFHLEDARDYIIRYGSAQDCHSPKRAISDQAKRSLDELAGEITGNYEYFWGESVSAAGSEIAFQRSTEKAAKRRRLMGVQIPVRFIKVSGGLI